VSEPSHLRITEIRTWGKKKASTQQDRTMAHSSGKMGRLCKTKSRKPGGIKETNLTVSVNTEEETEVGEERAEGRVLSGLSRKNEVQVSTI